jgi:large subunit ribosomal protein L13e
LILFPRRSGQHKKLDSSKSELKGAHEHSVKRLSTVLAIDSGIGPKHGLKEIKKKDMPEGVEGGAYRKLRKERSDARLVGVREKRAKAKAEAEESKKK